MSERRRVKLDKRGNAVGSSGDAPQEQAPDCGCPHLEAADWDGVESDWSDIAFVRTSTTAVMGVPVGYDSVKEDLRKLAGRIGATVPEDAMLLNGSGRFRRPVMMEVETEAPAGKDLVRPGGIAFTRLFDAPWGQLPKVAEKTRKEAADRYGRDPDDLWVWYLTCRECSRERNFETLVVTHYRDIQ
jgi:hypothetical protein